MNITVTNINWLLKVYSNLWKSVFLDLFKVNLYFVPWSITIKPPFGRLFFTFSQNQTSASRYSEGFMTLSQNSGESHRPQKNRRCKRRFSFATKLNGIKIPLNYPLLYVDIVYSLQFSYKKQFDATFDMYIEHNDICFSLFIYLHVSCIQIIYILSTSPIEFLGLKNGDSSVFVRRS